MYVSSKLIRALMKNLRALVFTLAAITCSVNVTHTISIKELSKDLIALSEIFRYTAKIKCLEGTRSEIILNALSSLYLCGTIAEAFPTVKKSFLKRSIKYQDGAVVAQGITAFLYMCTSIAKSAEEVLNWQPKTESELKKAANKKISQRLEFFTTGLSLKNLGTPDIRTLGILCGKFTRFKFVDDKFTALLGNMGSSFASLPDALIVFKPQNRTFIKKLHIFAATLFAGSSFTRALDKYNKIARRESVFTPSDTNIDIA